jgi:hypothetical protein
MVDFGGAMLADWLTESVEAAVEAPAAAILDYLCEKPSTKAGAWRCTSCGGAANPSSCAFFKRGGNLTETWTYQWIK